MTTSSSKWNLFFQTLELVQSSLKLAKGVRATAEIDIFLQGFLSFSRPNSPEGNLDGISIL